MEFILSHDGGGSPAKTSGFRNREATECELFCRMKSCFQEKRQNAQKAIRKVSVTKSSDKAKKLPSLFEPNYSPNDPNEAKNSLISPAAWLSPWSRLRESPIRHQSNVTFRRCDLTQSVSSDRDNVPLASASMICSDSSIGALNSCPFNNRKTSIAACPIRLFPSTNG